VTRADLAADGVEIAPVSVRSSAWEYHETASDGARVVEEMGLIDLAVTVRMRVGSARLERRVAVRRYASVEPDDDGQCRVRVQSIDLQREVSGS
jgi:hypothetical protein